MEHVLVDEADVGIFSGREGASPIVFIEFSMISGDFHRNMGISIGFWAVFWLFLGLVPRPFKTGRMSIFQRLEGVSKDFRGLFKGFSQPMPFLATRRR